MDRRTRSSSFHIIQVTFKYNMIVCVGLESAPQLGHQVLALAVAQKVSQIGECTDFHVTLGILVLCPHVRKEGVLRELEQTRVDRRFVWEDVEPDRRQLLRTKNVDTEKTKRERERPT